MNHNKNVILIGGPADGQRFVVPAQSRNLELCQLGLPNTDYDAPAAAHTIYAFQTVQGAAHAVFHVGVTDLSICPLLSLVAGYRKPKAHISDIAVAQHLVALIGGDSDGQRCPIADGRQTVQGLMFGDTYQIVPLKCKDGMVVRVGMLNTDIDPLSYLIEGYRFGEPK